MAGQNLGELEEAVNGVGKLISPAFDEVGAGFCLIGFSFGEGGWMTYVSNGERADVAKALRELADKIEREVKIPPGTEVH